MLFERDGVAYQLREQFDLSILREYGEVFCVFDKNDSGNISFGVRDKDRKLFIKVAGAKTIEMGDNNNPDAAIAALRHAAGVYKDLAHPALVKLVDKRQWQGGYALVFDWSEGECLHAYWTYDEYPKHTSEKSAFYRFVRLPLGAQLAALDTIFKFHSFVAQNKYVAIDFYDGSILYDFSNNKVTLCDIDFYEKMPYINRMGRMWGSSRFMSPEEFTCSAPIDEITNVFSMGATAFVLLGDGPKRSSEKWRANRALYDVALKAVAPRRDKRFPSIAAFIAAWEQAKQG